MGEVHKKKKAVDYRKLLESEKTRSEDYLKRLKYLQADYENLKNRTDRQIVEAKKYCTENLVTELLDVQNELELAIKNAKSTSSKETIIEGVQMTLKKLRKVLEQEGVSQIECKEGKVFDPNLHHAISATERDDIDECLIVEELRKGYTMREKVIRPSIVKVAVKSSKDKKSKS
jgi:molecular chaperone GrpE